MLTRMRKLGLLALWLFITPVALFAQSQQNISKELNWLELEVSKPDVEGYTHIKRPIWCNGCLESIENEYFIPSISELIPTDGRVITDIRLVPRSTKSIENREMAEFIKSDFEIKTVPLRIGGAMYTSVQVRPVRSTENGLEVLENFDLQLSFRATSTNTNLKSKKDQTYTSVLSKAESFKLSVVRSGVHRLDKAFFDQAGIDISGLRFSTFNIYGNGGAMLPEVIAEDRFEDLRQNAIYIEDQNGNDQMDAGDYVLWYAQGPDAIAYDLVKEEYNYSKHDFEDKAYYFVQWGQDPSLVLSDIPNGQALSPDLSLDRYDYIIHHEEDDINHIHSGRIWWGDEMSGAQTTKTFNYNVNGLVTGEQLFFKTITSARSLTSSFINITVNGQSTNSVHSSVSGEFDANYTAGSKYSQLIANVSSNNISVQYDYSKPLNDSKAWIDYFDIVALRSLNAYDVQQRFYASESLINGTVKYSLGSLTDHLVWDVTDYTRPANQLMYTDGSRKAFNVASTDQELRRYHIFRISDAFDPVYEEKVGIQNLHGLSDIEYIIVTHPSFEDQAEELAQFHRDESNLSVEVVLTTEVFNEFSSGSEDVTAIRDFTKLMYDRGLAGTKALRFICLFGDASYDHKNRIENNTNFVPIYQSYNSYLPAASHCSDDYYAILDDDEGYWGLSPRFEGLDIGVGRLPVSSTAEAQLIVDKIKHYHKGSFGNWVDRLSFLGDDEDNNVHFFCSEELTNIVASENPRFNVNKIWLDAFEQVSFGSGNKYPEVNNTVDQVINQGSLIFNYVGHGGTNGMAHERVVTRPQITAWENYDQLSFYITASCELATFDNPATKSPGELMLFDPNGGAIGMVATTRVVYIGANCDLNEDILRNNLFNQVNGESKPLGEVYMATRNRANSGQVINKRSFMLFADPAMGLLTPPNKVVPTSINGQSFASFNDTLKALSKVTIEGEIQDQSNQLMSNFNGILYPTIYDKITTYQTRGNDPKSYVADFDAQNSVIYKGKISVSNGKFSFSFIIPKDIAYHFGEGKLSFYAEDGIDHAGGFDNSIMVGGTTDSLKVDQQFDSLSLFIDDRSWVFGGSTGFTPLLLADLYDENGINTVGSGIGREMEAVLDEGTEDEQLIVLNDFFQPELNSYQAGEINYRFSELNPGRHTIRLKVWDVYNNSAEAYTEFVVADKEGVQVSNLLNYPNPFNQFTTFHFDHNKGGQMLDIKLKIMSVTGRVVFSTTETLLQANAHSADITWNGRDQFGDPIGRGVYLYELEVQAEDGSTEKQTQKLYIIQ